MQRLMKAAASMATRSRGAMQAFGDEKGNAKSA
jgi:hypothetical protein